MFPTSSNTWQTPVSASAEFVRIRSLPVHRWWEGTDRELFRLKLSENLRLPGSTETLRPIQVAAFEAIHDNEGCFASIRVDGGKTLISLLAPVVIGSERPLLLLPGSLREKTQIEAKEYAKHWKLHRNLCMVSYEKLSRDGSLCLLDDYNPDFLILDEFHFTHDSGGPRAKRIRRFKESHPLVKVMVMTGSPVNRSIGDYWHIMRWCLPNTMPMPRDFFTFMEWREALDGDVFPQKHPGVLVDLHPEAEGATPSLKAQDAYARRLADTPGVVISRDRGPETPLIVRGVEPPLNLKVIEPMVFQLRENWEVPDGTPFESALELWRHVRHAVCGFYSVWDPQPPHEWRERRREWSRFCRYATKHLPKRMLDTEGAVRRAIKEGRLDDGGLLQAWLDIQPTFIPKTRTEWLDDSLLIYCAEWMEKYRGLMWVEDRDFALRLEQISGVPFFYSRGFDRHKRFLDTWQGPAIVSRKSNSTGRNLHAWNRNFVVSHVPNGKQWEQTLGRTHRQLQEAPEVIYENVIISLEQWREMLKAIRDAERIERLKRQPQKLVYAKKEIIGLEEVERRAQTEYLWQDTGG